jgi:hypothetical protein
LDVVFSPGPAKNDIQGIEHRRQAKVQKVLLFDLQQQAKKLVLRAYANRVPMRSGF